MAGIHGYSCECLLYQSFIPFKILQETFAILNQYTGDFIVVVVFGRSRQNNAQFFA